jgi:FixJ family two-component response regulator
MPNNARVFVIDRRWKVRQSLKLLFESEGLVVETFSSAAEFLERPIHDGPSCLVIDSQLPGLSGLEAQEYPARTGVTIPIVFLSRQVDVTSTTQPTRGGVVDFHAKPADDSELRDAVARALTRAAEAQRRREVQTESGERVARLTARERQVVDLVARGLLNKQIAYTLGISEETVKVHRGHAMRKLEVDSVPSLVRLLDRAIS